MFRDPWLAPFRLGQRSFQVVVLNAYHRRCAITGTKIRPVLQAAHIRPVSEAGERRLDNGLLLRSDVHTLFDRAYPGVDPAYRLRVSPRLREDFGNGDRFYAQARATRRPSRTPRGPAPARIPGVAPRRGIQSLLSLEGFSLAQTARS